MSPATGVDRLSSWGYVPSRVERPETAAELARLLGDAAREAKTVVPIGHATALAYLGRAPRCDVAIDLERLDGIVELNPGDLTVTVGAGTPIDALTPAIAEANLWLPGAALGPGTIGGLLACGQTSARGGEAYGALRDRVLGLQVAGADGKLTVSGGRVVKNVAGYDLHRLHPGTGGAFGVLTEVTLRLEPLPERRAGVRLHCEEASRGDEAWRWLRRGGPEVAVLSGVFGEGGAFVMEAHLLGDEEVVEAGVDSLLDGWRRWGETGRTPGDALPVPEPHWVAQERELAFSVRTSPSGSFARAARLESWLGELGLERRLVVYPNLGEIKFAAAGQSARQNELWERITTAAVGGDLNYRVENAPPDAAMEFPAWSASPELLRLLARLKSALDPGGTLRPGAYSIEALETAAEFFAARGAA